MLLRLRATSDVSIGRQANGPILLKQLEGISISPYETLGCPRVGIDPAADTWAETAYDKSAEKREGMSFEEFKRRLHGEYVLGLAPPSDGLPSYASGPGRYVEGYAFRGKALTEDGIEEILGSDLHIQAWMHFSPQELVEYSDQLEAAARHYVREQEITCGVMSLKMGDEISHEEELLLIILSTARWCRYWGENGHPVWSDY
ncbi:hypothetical protein [Microvirga sp. TS319]|uniref:hypothetical protein n=1 Tax=Microvirga sp. TS319 TaxID=3241165 RepID=UPI00351A6BB2